MVSLNMLLMFTSDINIVLETIAFAYYPGYKKA